MSTPKMKDGRGKMPGTHSEVSASEDKTLYRVRDKDWTTVWAEHLTRADADALVTKLTSTLKSRSARREPMNVTAPDGLPPYAVVYPQMGGVRLGGPVHAFDQVAPPKPSVPEAPFTDISTVKRDGKIYTYGTRRSDGRKVVLSMKSATSTPSVPTIGTVTVDPQLIAAHNSALAAAGQAARQAQARADAEVERSKKIAQAEEIEKMMESGEIGSMSDDDLAELLGGTGELPSDDEIKAAHERANGSAEDPPVIDDQDSDAPVV